MTDQPTIETEHFLPKVESILQISDQITLAALKDEHTYYEKGDRDFSSDVDLAVEQAVKSELKKIDDRIPILGEEFSWDHRQEEDEKIFWAVDPIDGTVNYSRKLPLFGTSIALIRDGLPILSGVSFPVLRESYTAGLGVGAFLNGGRISVSMTSEFSEAIAAYGDFAVGGEARQKNSIRYDFLEHLADQVLRIRMPGSAALQLAWLASGRADISITLSNNAWDVQGGVLLVREAGGEVYDLDGSQHTVRSRYTLASNPLLRSRVLDYFKKRPKRD